MPTTLNIFLQNHILKTKSLICQILDFYISFICYVDVNSTKLKKENDQLVVIMRVDLAELIKTLRNKVGKIGLGVLNFLFLNFFFPVQSNMILVFVGGFSVIFQKLGQWKIVTLNPKKKKSLITSAYYYYYYFLR